MFKRGYWDNPAYLLPTEADLMAITHYLEALDLQKEIVKAHTIFGGKNPHPNWIVDGVPCPINMERLNLVSTIIDKCMEFNTNVYLLDIMAIGGFYKNWLCGGGLSGKSVMAFGDIPENENDDSAANLHLPRGAIINGNLSEVHDVDLRDPEQVQECVDHSWFTYAEAAKGLHPWDGVTEPNCELGPNANANANANGTRTNIQDLDEAAKYSWRSARWCAMSSATPRTTKGSKIRSTASMRHGPAV